MYVRVCVHGVFVLGPFHHNCRLSIGTKNRSFSDHSVKFPISIVKRNDT